MEASDASSRGKLDYIVAGCASLKRRAAGGALRPQQLEQMLQEARRLTADLQPLLCLAGEFKAKWEVQKSALVAQKRAEIDAFLLQRDEEAQQSFAQRAAAELADLDQAMIKGSAPVAKDLEAILRATVEDWRSEARGANLVKGSDAERALQSAMARVGAWAARQEQQLMGTWKETIWELVQQIHTMDLQAFEALEGPLKARRQILEDLLGRQKRELNQAYKQLQEQLAERTGNMLQTDREKERKRDKKADRRLLQKEAQAAAAQRSEAAKAEALRALEAQGLVGCLELDRRAARVLLKRSLLHEQLAEQAAPLKAHLEVELQRRLEALQRRAVRRKSEGSALANCEAPEGAGRSEASEGEEEVRLEVAVQRNRLGSELSELRNELQPLLAMALQGEWGVRSWPKDIKAAAQKGAGSAQDAKTALDVQAQIFQRQESEEWLKEAILSMVKCTKDFQAQLAPKFGEVQRRQRELSAQRAEYLQQTCQKEEQQLKESEAEVLKAIAKLVPEVEAMTELGSVASPFGAPLGLVAGCWRRAIKCMLPALLRLWDLAGTEPGE